MKNDKKVDVENSVFYPKPAPFVPGQGLVSQVAKFKSVLLNTSTFEDVQEITKMLIRKAKGGDLVAAKIFLSYCCGSPDKVEESDAVTINMERLTAAEKLELLEKL